MNRRFRIFLILAVLVFSAGILASCMTLDQNGIHIVKPNIQNNGSEQDVPVNPKEITILYTNDVHTHIENDTKNSDGNTVPGLSYASLASYRDQLKADGKTVILVDCGDFAQGTAYGGMDKGKTMVSLMEAAGIEVVAVGNHDFDYGIPSFFDMIQNSSIPFLSCNFFSLPDHKLVLPPSSVIERNGIRIAFIGISTPETLTSTSPVYFMDEKQQNYLYSFSSENGPEEFYQTVQSAIDAVSSDADYVIAIGHLGVDEVSAPYRSTDVIANTTGLDAFIDGHSHTVVPQETVLNKSGEPVILTQTGCYFSNIGEMTLSPDGITSKLIPSVDGKDDTVKQLEDNWAKQIDEKLGEKIAVSDVDFCTMDPDHPSVRLIRNREMNAGDFFADAFYYYFNLNMQIDCDFTYINGGGIRTDLPAGDVTYKSIKDINPFGNVGCIIEVTGQQILDLLEWNSSCAGLFDKDGNPDEFGGFMHVSGLVYSIHTNIESSVPKTAEETWGGPPTGEYRVHDVMIYDRSQKSYVPLDLGKSYTVGSYNYNLKSLGNGASMLKDAKVVTDFVSEDYLITAEYAKAFIASDDGFPHLNSAGSPLQCYPDFRINYETPTGSGRILFD